VAYHHDDLKTGLQPFTVMDGSKEFRATALELSRSFGLLYKRELGVSYSDLAQFKIPKDVRSYPISSFDLEQNLGIFGSLLGTVLGGNHPLTRNYRVFSTALTRQYRQRLRQQLEGFRSSLKPVHILWNVQLVCFDWLDSKKSLGAPEASTFVAILHTIGLGTYVAPLLPLHLYQLINHKNIPHPTPTPGNLTTPGGPPSLACTTGTSADDASTVAGSAVSAITGVTGLTAASQKQSRLVVNESPDTHLLSLIPFNHCIKDLISNTQPPNTDDCLLICLSFHTKGGCYTKCRRKNTHSHVLTLSEKERLENCIADRLEKLSKG
jgi:hypothetical protein